MCCSRYLRFACNSTTYFKVSLLLLAITYSWKVNAHFNQLIFHNYTVRDGLSQNTVTSIGQDQMGFMWFGTFDGLNRFDGYDFVHYKNNPNDNSSLSNNRCHNIVNDSKGNLWVVTLDSTYNRYNVESDNFSRFQSHEAPEEVQRLVEKKTQSETITYKHHQFIFHNEQERVFTYTNLITQESTNQVIDYSNPQGIHDSYLVSVFIDNNHCLWVGSYSKGIYKADLERKAFNLFSFGEQIPNSQSLNNIRSIWQDNNGELWLGTRNYGLLWLDSLWRIKHHFYAEPFKSKKIAHKDENDVRKVYRDSKNRLWVCSKRGISYLNEEKLQLVNVFYGERWDLQYFTFNVTEDSKGRIWFSTFSGLAQWDNQTQKVIIYDKSKGVEIHPSLRFVLIDKSGRFWVGSELGGLALLTPIEEKADGTLRFTTTRFLATDSVLHPISDNRLYSASMDETGAVWFGTGSGLNRFNEITGQFDWVRIAEGLSNDMIMGILPDGNGNVWVSHKRGVSRVNIKTLSVTNFSTADGLQNDEFNEDAYFKNQKTGELFFGGSRGFNHFFPTQITANQPTPAVIITNISVDGQKVNIGDTIGNRVAITRNIVLTRQIELPYHVKSISIQFAAIAFSSPENIAFEYKLDGFDNNWIKADPKMRQANYTNIEPGDYQFMVKAINNDGVWSDQPLQLHLLIHPPFWQTWWFRLGVAILTVLALVTFFYMRLYSLRRKNLLLEQKVAERTHAVELRNSQISEQMTQITEQNRIISNKNEEITTQAEQLAQQKNFLQDAFEELDQYRNKLEKLVDERTSELLLAKEKAEESDRLKTSFLSNLSHEIRTPLNAIEGFTSFLFDNAFTEEEKWGFKSIIDSNCESLVDLIEEIIDYARIEADQVHICLQPSDIAKLMKQFRQTYELQLQSHHPEEAIEAAIALHLNIEIPEWLKQIQTDEKRLLQVMTYLISNAIKFTVMGEIEVGCRLNHNNNMITFYVKDTGIGISQENQKIIFDSFRKIEANKSNIYRGVGLGLSIASRLTQLMGGRIFLESEIGKGATFYVEFPLLPSNTSPPK